MNKLPSINDIHNRIKANFVFASIYKGLIPTEMQFCFGNRTDIVKIYTNETDAINNIYNDTFVAIILSFPTIEDKFNFQGWVRSPNEIVWYLMSEENKEYNLDVNVPMFSGNISTTGVRIYKIDQSKPSIVQNEIEFPSNNHYLENNPQEAIILPYTVNRPASCTKYIKIPNPYLIRIAIRSYDQLNQKVEVPRPLRSTIKNHVRSQMDDLHKFSSPPLAANIINLFLNHLDNMNQILYGESPYDKIMENGISRGNIVEVKNPNFKLFQRNISPIFYHGVDYLQTEILSPHSYKSDGSDKSSQQIEFNLNISNGDESTLPESISRNQPSENEKEYLRWKLRNTFLK